MDLSKFTFNKKIIEYNGKKEKNLSFFKSKII